MDEHSSSDIASQLAALKPGSHLCFFYRSQTEKLGVLEPFLRQGLDKGEKVIYVLNDMSSLADVATCSCEPGQLQNWLSIGQMKVLNAQEVYLDGGVFSAEKMIAKWQKECELALSEGYPALRAAAEMDWALGTTPLEELTRYEWLVEDLFHRFPVIGLCQYDLRRFAEPYAAHQLLAHPWVVARNQAVVNRFYPRAEAPQSLERAPADFSSLLDSVLQSTA